MKTRVPRSVITGGSRPCDHHLSFKNLKGMKSQKKPFYSWLSGLLACILASSTPGYTGDGLAWILILVCDSAYAGAGQAKGSQPAAKTSTIESRNASQLSKFSTSPSDAEIFAARVFDEPLVPLNGESHSDENKAL